MKQITDIKQAIVRKSNQMIQNARYDLSLQEQKVILYIISHISPLDTDFTPLEFSISEFCAACKIYRSGKNYKDLKAVVIGLKRKCWWLKLPSGKVTTVSWIDKATIDPTGGKIAIRLDTDLKPYLLQLQANYTEYDLSYVLAFKSRYSIRLYEYVKSVHYHDLQPWTTREISLDELRELLGTNEYDAEGQIAVVKYQTWQHFRDRALTPAIAEINTYSDKTITYTTSKQGQKVTGVIFTITTRPIGERITADLRQIKAQ